MIQPLDKSLAGFFVDVCLFVCFKLSMNQPFDSHSTLRYLLKGKKWKYRVSLKVYRFFE